MKQSFVFNGKTIEYELEYKQVKHCNLRIGRDGEIKVSANRRIPKKYVEEFVASKAEWILNVLRKIEETPLPTAHCSQQELRKKIQELCERAYPYYQQRGVEKPQIKFRNMVSRWGSCHPGKGIVTFNLNLIYAPDECVEYVVWHEFTHFLQPNHSREFYQGLEQVFPRWRDTRKQLKEIRIR